MAVATSIKFKSIETLLASARRNGRRNLTEPETKAILKLAGFSIPKEHLVTNARDAMRVAGQIGFPVVLKVVSPDLPHKSDIGGVRLDLHSRNAVRNAYYSILKDVRARSSRISIEGILVQQQLEGIEVILGATTDPQFGPVIIFGLGGIYVEALNDTVCRLIPITRQDAQSMVAEIKSAPLLNGFRGLPRVDKRSIVTALSRLSTLVARFPDQLQELDINPMLVNAQGAVAVDAMALLTRSPSDRKAPDRRNWKSRHIGQSSHSRKREALSKPLKALFAPRSVAIVGASASKSKSGYFILKNILDGGFSGRVYPVNPRAKQILNCRCYASVRDLPEPPDLVIVVVANEHVKTVLQDCAIRKAKAVTIVTAGFGEIGKAGSKAQDALTAIIRESAMRVVGPNSVGLVSAPNKLVGSFVPFPKWPAGPVAIASQTGIFTGAYVDALAAQSTQRFGFSRSICLGNKIDVDEVDFLEYAANDAASRVIAIHLESFRRPREFLAAANRANQNKPVVVFKTGRTEAGARVAASHSGALSSPDRIVTAALKQYGIVHVETLEEFIGTMKAFAWQPVPRGNRAAIVTLSGAMGVMAVDEMGGTGLTLAKFAPATVKAIANLMPKWQPVQNPADIWMALGSGPEKAHAEILDAVLTDPGVDMLLCVLLPIPNADFSNVRKVFKKLTATHPDKPLFLIMLGGQIRQRWLRQLDSLHLPVYSDPRSAVRAMAAMQFYGKHRNRLGLDPRM